MTDTAKLIAYPIEGTLSRVTQRQDRYGKPYLFGMLTFTTKAGKPYTIKAFAFGRAMTLVGRSFANGPTRLYGVFRSDSFQAIQEAMAPRPIENNVVPMVAPKMTTTVASEKSEAAPEKTHEGGPVGGHWKNQPCGPRQSLRKMIWVVAYKRGS